MSHRSLADYYERRFAQQRTEEGAGEPPPHLTQAAAKEWLKQQISHVDIAAQTGQLAEPNDWLEDHVKAGNMRRVVDGAHGEHYEWIGAGPAPGPNDIPCSPPFKGPDRRSVLLNEARKAVLSDPIGRALRATMTEAEFDRIVNQEVDLFLSGAADVPQDNPEPISPKAAAVATGLVAKLKSDAQTNPFARALVGNLTDAELYRIASQTVNKSLRGADDLQEHQNPEPDPPAGTINK